MGRAEGNVGNEERGFRVKHLIPGERSERGTYSELPEP
jgi:hypothetical protein